MGIALQEFGRNGYKAQNSDTVMRMHPWEWEEIGITKVISANLQLVDVCCQATAGSLLQLQSLRVVKSCTVSSFPVINSLTSAMQVTVFIVTFSILCSLLPRDAMQAQPMPSCGVCPSVCLTRSWILSKCINISSEVFHRRIATPFQFFHTERHGSIPTGTPYNGGVECR